MKCLQKEDIYYGEKYLIAYYRSNNREFGYNNSSGGELSSLGIKHSDETKRNMSEIAKRRPKRIVNDSERIKRSRAIKQYSLTGEYIKTWIGASFVYKELYIDSASITNCCKGNKKSAGGFIWRYI